MGIDMEIREFGSLEEVQKFLTESRKAAINRIVPFQEKIGYGDYALTISQVLIVGRIHTIEDNEKWWDANMKDWRENPEQVEEFNAEQQMTKANYEDGFRFGTWYSVYEPNGELGSKHCSTFLCKLTEEEFNFIRSLLKP